MTYGVKKCKECGRLFNYMGKDLCAECMIKLDEMFVKIRDYLDEHPHARISELSEELDIREKVIMDFIKQGRIELKEAVITCVNCGRPVYTGTLCDDCKANIGGKINEAVEAKRKMMEEFETGVSVNYTGGMHVKK